MCDMIHPYVWHDSSICMWHGGTCVSSYLIDVCNKTHSQVRHDSFTCVTWLIHTYDKTHSYLWQGGPCVSCLINVCNKTHSHVWHDSSMCDIIHPYVWHDSFMCETPRLISMCDTEVCGFVPHWCVQIRLVHMCDIIHHHSIKLMASKLTHTHTHTHKYIFIYIYMCILTSQMSVIFSSKFCKRAGFRKCLLSPKDSTNLIAPSHTQIELMHTPWSFCDVADIQRQRGAGRVVRVCLCVYMCLGAGCSGGCGGGCGCVCERDRESLRVLLLSIVVCPCPSLFICVCLRIYIYIYIYIYISIYITHAWYERSQSNQAWQVCSMVDSEIYPPQKRKKNATWETRVISSIRASSIIRVQIVTSMHCLQSMSGRIER